MGKNELIEEQIRSRGPQWYRASVGTAAVAALFCLVVCALLVARHVRDLRLEPIQNPRLEALKQELRDLRDAPSAGRKSREQQLREEIRAADLEIRSAYLRSRSFTLRGAFLLLGGAAVFLIALRYAVLFRKRLPAPKGHAARGRQRRITLLARWAVAALGLVVIAGGAAVGLASLAPRTELPPAAVDPTDTWPRFRGPGGLGISEAANVPTDWDGPTVRNILWRSPIPLPGHNSPVVWADRVFVTGADEQKREVYCYDAHSGKLLWRHDVAGIPDSYAGLMETSEEYNRMTGYAPSTVATDGRRVFAIFVNGDLVALDFEGRRLWARSLGKPDSAYRHASSLLTWRNLLIIQLDQGLDADKRLSSIMALDTASGTVVWDTPRPVRNSWSTPIVIRTEQGEEQIIAAGSPWVIAYNPLTGEDLWRANCLAPQSEGATVDVAASPAYANGVVYVCNEFAALAAVRTDGRGDVSATHVLFKTSGNLPDIVSPLCDGKYVYLVRGYYVTCCDARTGSEVWEHEFKDAKAAFYSSPTLVGDTVYLLDGGGVMHWFKARTGKYEPLGTARLGADSTCTPAFVNGRIYIRGFMTDKDSAREQHYLTCVGTPNAAH